MWGLKALLGEVAVFLDHNPKDNSSSHNLYDRIAYKGTSYFKDYFYGARFLVGAINNNQNTLYGFIGPVYGDWSIKTSFGINQVPKYRDRDSGFLSDSADLLKGDGYSRR